MAGGGVAYRVIVVPGSWGPLFGHEKRAWIRGSKSYYPCRETGAFAVLKKLHGLLNGDDFKLCPGDTSACILGSS
jgi:hypothetical protein